MRVPEAQFRQAISVADGDATVVAQTLGISPQAVHARAARLGIALADHRGGARPGAGRKPEEPRQRKWYGGGLVPGAAAQAARDGLAAALGVAPSKTVIPRDPAMPRLPWVACRRMWQG